MLVKMQEVGTLGYCWWEKNGAAAVEGSVVASQNVKHGVTI